MKRIQRNGWYVLCKVVTNTTDKLALSGDGSVRRSSAISYLSQLLRIFKVSTVTIIWYVRTKSLRNAGEMFRVRMYG